jgi:hypothetical protein
MKGMNETGIEPERFTSIGKPTGSSTLKNIWPSFRARRIYLRNPALWKRPRDWRRIGSNAT